MNIIKMVRLIVVVIVLAASLGAQSAVKTGDLAPTFKVHTLAGKDVNLSKVLAGKKWVVLEWFNPDCPFVKKHYLKSKNIPALRNEFTAGSKNVEWYAVSTGGNPQTLKKALKDYGLDSSHVLLDEKGELGKTYGALTTPHFFIINPAGQVAYQGAIDDQPDTEAGSIPQSKNYVKAALTEGLAGKTITVSTTEPYGCSVKYAH